MLPDDLPGSIHRGERCAIVSSPPRHLLARDGSVSFRLLRAVQCIEQTQNAWHIKFWAAASVSQT